MKVRGNKVFKQLFMLYFAHRIRSVFSRLYAQCATGLWLPWNLCIQKFYLIMLTILDSVTVVRVIMCVREMIFYILHLM